MKKNGSLAKKNGLTATVESTLFSSLLMTVWAKFYTLVCKTEDLKKDPKPGNGSGGLLGKSVTFVGLPPSTSPDSSPVSTLSIVSSMFQHFRQFQIKLPAIIKARGNMSHISFLIMKFTTAYLQPKHALKSLQLNWNLHLCCLNHFLLLYVEIYSFWLD